MNADDRVRFRSTRVWLKYNFYAGTCGFFTTENLCVSFLIPKINPSNTNAPTTPIAIPLFRPAV